MKLWKVWHILIANISNWWKFIYRFFNSNSSYYKYSLGSQFNTIHWISVTWIVCMCKCIVLTVAVLEIPLNERSEKRFPNIQNLCFSHSQHNIPFSLISTISFEPHQTQNTSWKFKAPETHRTLNSTQLSTNTYWPEFSTVDYLQIHGLFKSVD